MLLNINNLYTPILLLMLMCIYPNPSFQVAFSFKKVLFNVSVGKACHYLAWGSLSLVPRRLQCVPGPFSSSSSS